MPDDLTDFFPRNPKILKAWKLGTVLVPGILQGRISVITFNDSNRSSGN